MGDEVSSAPSAPSPRGSSRSRRTLDDSLETEKTQNDFLTACPPSSRPSAVRQDRVPCLPQGQVPRQGLHHPRPAGGRRVLRSGRLVQLHLPRPARQHRAQRSDHGGPEVGAAGVVRAALERSRGHHPRDPSHVERHIARVYALRGLVQGPGEYFRGHELTAGRMGRGHVDDLPAARQVPAGRLQESGARSPTAIGGASSATASVSARPTSV